MDSAVLGVLTSSTGQRAAQAKTVTNDGESDMSTSNSKLQSQSLSKVVIANAINS